MELFCVMRHHLSPVILALIFITCFHNVLSRHSIRHYKDRFKRQQGAHLYLPGSFVIEGDDGPDAGPWSDWSEPSPCSRTCGGGVSTQQRTCQQGYTCRGPDRRHFSCNTQDCPDTGDFRSQQCSEYDSVPFEGISYQWVPYTKAPNPCELNCMPRGERFYYRHAATVIDGTRCTDESLDVCVNGTCQPVGCDMMLGSNAREDECRVCGGDGSTCNTVSHTLEMRDMQVGYNDILLIPAGATNVNVQEVAPSNNYLAVRNGSGHYYLNGNWRIDFPRTMEFAGTKFHYDRSPQGFSAPDKISALGPTDEVLFIVLLFQDSDVPVSYKYSLPTNVQPGSESETYAWTFDQFAPCSATCGGGIQYRNVTCAGRKTLEPVNRTLCDANSEPESSRRCNEIPCEAQWTPHPWGNCSAPCGEGGTQSREISCQQIVSNGYPSLVDESECSARGPKPPQQQKCNVGKTCANWHTGPWKPCDHLCGEGKQTRKVQCYIKDKENKINLLDDAECQSIEPKPDEEKKCNIRPCEGVDWITSEWSGCDTVCGLKNETRKIFCATSEGQIYADELCEKEQKPKAVRKCDTTNTTCNYLWYASQWSECSATCGQGVQTRELFCGVSTEEGVKKVEIEKCDQSKHFDTLKNCTGNEECDGEWFSGPWGECSKPCGGGEKTRKVVCLQGDKVVEPSHCDSDKIIFAHEDCNKEACSDDSIIPTDVTKSIDESEKTPEQEKVTATTEVILTETTIAESPESSKETEMPQSDLTDITNSFEITSQRSSEKETIQPEAEDEEYEIVPADECDDGEWVDDDDETEEQEPLSTETESSVTEESTETTFSLDDLMLSDGTTATGDDTKSTGLLSTETGSGEEESSPTGVTKSSSFTDTSSSGLSETTDEEGSGTEPTIVSDDFETEITSITTSGLSSGSTDGVSGTSTVSGSSDETTISDTTLSNMSTELSSVSSSDLTTEGSTGSSESSTGVSGSTEGATKSSDSTESSGTTESESSSLSSESSSSLSSESTSTDVSSSTDVTQTTESGMTESTISVNGTEVTSSDSSTDSSDTTESSVSTTDISSSDVSTDSSTDLSSTSSIEITTSNIHFLDESDYGIREKYFKTTTTTTTQATTTGVSDTSELSSSSESSTEVSGTTETTGQFTGSTTEFTGSTETSESTTDFSTTEFTGSTETAGSTTEFTGSTVEYTGSTVPSSTEGTTESTTEFAGSTESTTEFTGSTESTTEFTGSTESTTEFTGTTDYDIFGSPTQSSETTEESTSTDEYGTTSITDIFTSKKPRLCKRRKTSSCVKTKYGCCWDKITPAKGPFDKGCPLPKTCKESKFGCCEDGVSAALGPKFKGCPSTHCNESLFGCCPDKKTPAEGNNNEGCPPPPPVCLKSKWGCCKDNVTEAKGPKGKGCEPEAVSVTEPQVKEDCSNTTYRCCPDGVTTAKGPGYQGCDLPCSNSTYGCCQDGKTPAHGPSGEGCCLSTPFGCCPDNVIPARGPNLDGCGCQYSPYGCCPDNTTSARGYNNEGCGCKFSEHGCCPDDYTSAYGPNYEGCLCHTFQFGCCPDGIASAKGPHQLGCGCRNTEFGCCADEETPASGPNKAGCGCESSKYGCCLDGVTEAKGENFEECEEQPANLQESCLLSKERGSCRNYTVKWFFDMDYGGCSRFWYGGCDGNGNRYKSKEECEQVCIQPQGADKCNLPKVSGPCEGYYPQWYYDKNSKHCAQFIYGGCLGNNNRFETREECQELCVKDDSVDACEQPKEQGPCRGGYRRYYFDKESQQCREFAYGGCKGNNNNFQTIEACNQKCATPGRKKDHCSLPRAQGNCTGKEPRWYYDTPERRCLPFYYSGCNGNQNNFNSKEVCETDCPLDIVKDTCHLPAETGECANYVDRWYFDTKEKTCRQFYYGGCGGNGNNFETQQTCQQRCEQRQAPLPQPPPQPEPQPGEPQRPEPAEPVAPAEPFKIEMCFLPSESGPCRGNEVRYYYDRNDGVCKSFVYGGCQGNGNNFNSIEECLQRCGVAQDLCTLPVVVGPCNGEYPQFYYEPSTDSCKPFKFGGCGGNYNRFHDQDSCERRCRKAPPAQGTQAPPSAPPSDIAMCYESVDAGNCTESHALYYYDKDTRACAPFTYTGCGGNGNRFNSEEQCERQCGAFRGQDVCNMERDPGPCRGYFVKYYYEKSVGRCGPFAYGGCQGNGNRFSSNEECERLCVTHQETKPNNQSSTAICQLPPDQGSCPGRYDHKRWYFNYERGQCVAFIFTGCGGNFNNFKTFESCNEFCRDLVAQTEPPVPVQPTDLPPHECQAVFDECTRLRCPYGVEAYIDDSDCNSCRCHDPCDSVECPDDTQCAIDLNRNKTSMEDADFIAICREINKTGQCPNLQQSDTNCEQECRNDADCTLHLKCCSTGCGTSCIEPLHPPGELITQQPSLPAYTEAPIESIYQPPIIDVEIYEPEVSALIGDKAILNCAVTGNPNPKITWSKDNILIDGTQPRYRIKLDQTLQIITLHKTDSGLYLCTANNSIGEPIINQIKLDVLDSPPRQASILEPEDQPLANQIVSFNAPTTLNCYALGFPYPAVTWWKDDSMIPLKNNEFEVRKDYSLLIHSVQLKNLGVYTCQAYNGVGKAASWVVTVKALGPYHSHDPKDIKYLQYIVNPQEEPGRPTTTPVPYSPPQRPHRPRPPYVPPTPEPYVPPYYETEQYPEPNEIMPDVPAAAVVPTPDQIVPLRANITTNDQRYPTGGEIQLPCEVQGHPAPQVQWYKDGVPIYPTDRILISETNTLTIQQAQKADSGTYQCEATNSYSRASSTLEISVEGMYIHPSCTDNKFFANCALIVRGNYCTHKYYAKFCCRSCTEAGLLPVDAPQVPHISQQNAIDNNLL